MEIVYGHCLLEQKIGHHRRDFAKITADHDRYNKYHLIIF